MSVRGLVELWSSLFRHKASRRKTEPKEDENSSFKSINVEDSMEYFDTKELAEGKDTLSSGRSSGRSNTSEIMPGATWKHVGSESNMDTLEFSEGRDDARLGSGDGSDTATVICLHDQMNHSMSLELENNEENFLLNPSENYTEDTYDTESRFIESGRDEASSDAGSVILEAPSGHESWSSGNFSQIKLDTPSDPPDQSCGDGNGSPHEGSVVNPYSSVKSETHDEAISEGDSEDGSVIFPDRNSSPDCSDDGSVVLLPKIDADESQLYDLEWDRIPSEDSSESFKELNRPTSFNSMLSGNLESISENEEVKSFPQVRDTRDSVETIDSFIDHSTPTAVSATDILPVHESAEGFVSTNPQSDTFQSPPTEFKHLNGLQVADSRTKYRPTAIRQKPEYAMTYPPYHNSSDSPRSQNSDLTEGSSPKRRFARGNSSQSRSRQFLLQNLLERAKSTNSVTSSSDENIDNLRITPSEDSSKRRVQFHKDEVSGVSHSEEVLTLEDLQGLFYTDEEASVFKDDYDNEYQVAAALDLSWYDWMHQDTLDESVDKKSISS